MKPHEFHAKFANTPLKDRYTIINMVKYGDLNLTKIYESIKQYEDVIRPYEIKMQNLLKAADEYYFKDLDIKIPEKRKTKVTKCPNCGSRKFTISIFGSICGDCFYEEK